MYFHGVRKLEYLRDLALVISLDLDDRRSPRWSSGLSSECVYDVILLGCMSVVVFSEGVDQHIRLDFR